MATVTFQVSYVLGGGGGGIIFKCVLLSTNSNIKCNNQFYFAGHFFQILEIRLTLPSYPGYTTWPKLGL